jgi:uncharacterized protein
MSNSPAPSGWPHATSPYHRGEHIVQERTGAREFAERIGRQVIRDYMPEQHREFFRHLSYLFVGTVDKEGQPWATVLIGRPGFVGTDDPRHLRVQITEDRGDPCLRSLAVDADVAFVGIELETRRRNRLNGRVTARNDDLLEVCVSQSFGNCPQYIQSRSLLSLETRPGDVLPEGPNLSTLARRIVAAADTFFIASASPGGGTVSDPTQGVDVNHRGGRPGFLRVVDDPTGSMIEWPDFVGNSAFNTLGNITLNPRAGLLFVDFGSGDVLSLTGRAEILWDAQEVERFQGAQRIVRFFVTRGELRPGMAPARWSEPRQAPQLQRTGIWSESAVAARAAGSTQARPFKITRILQESETVRSLYLRPADGLPIAAHTPGQFLPLSIDIDGQVVRRSYTITNQPGQGEYRLSVKKLADGHAAPPSASRWLHDHATTGTVLTARPPAGEFVLDNKSSSAVVFLSAGIGITPMIAMVDALLSSETERPLRPDRPVWFIHFVRNSEDHAFGAHLRSLARRHSNLHVHVYYSDPLKEDELAKDYDGVGVISKTLLQSLLPLDAYDVYLCGPAGFMQAAYDHLVTLGVGDARIRAEAFGPSSLARRATSGDVSNITAPLPPAAPVAAAEVRFARTGKQVTWRPENGTLLDLAEASGVEASWGCRAGSCGTCRTNVSSGAVSHRPGTAASHGPLNTALICSAVPASEVLTLEL